MTGRGGDLHPAAAVLGLRNQARVITAQCEVEIRSAVVAIRNGDCSGVVVLVTGRSCPVAMSGDYTLVRAVARTAAIAWSEPPTLHSRSVEVIGHATKIRARI
jgi:hypothetical protein